MARTERPYVRVYYVDLQRDYPAIYADKPVLGLWTTLLVMSDQSWPVAPELPASMRRADLKKLADATLVELLPAHRFRIKGYEAERSGRQASAQAAAALRWHSGSNANGHADAVRPHMQTHSERSADAMPRAGSNAPRMPRPSTENPSTKDSQHGKPKNGRAAVAPADEGGPDGLGDPERDDMEWLR